MTADGAGQRVGQALTGDGVDAEARRGGHRLLTVLAQLGDDLRAEPAGSADDDDLHDGPSSRVAPRASEPSGACGLSQYVASEPGRLGQGVGHGVRADDVRGAVVARLDAQHEVVVLVAREADQLAAGPELGGAVERLLRADDRHRDVVHR